MALIILGLFVAGCTGIGGPAGQNQTNVSICGDGKVTGAEECDKNVSCKNAAAICTDKCECKLPAAPILPPALLKNVSCANNSVTHLANGTNITFDNKTMLCKDDCSRLSPAASCNGVNCTCTIPPVIPRGCLANTMITTFTGTNSFDPRSMICQDDCWRVDPTMTCTAACICSKKTYNCAANTAKAGPFNPFNPASDICKDDCKTIDPTMTCNAGTCTCQKNPPPTCLGNSFAVAFGAPNNFNPFGGLACKDDCADIDPNLVCDAVKCLCDYPPNRTNETLPCATNTVIDAFGGGNMYDPAKHICKDNCKELDPTLACDGATCTCTKTIITENESASCAARTTPGMTTRERVKPGFQCKDDCQSVFGSGYTCNAASCTCVPPGTYPTYSCYNNSLDFAYDGGTAYPIPANYRCQDDCAENEDGLVCDPVRCVCKPKVNITEGTSCSVNTFDSDLYNISTYKPGGLCKDDCKSGYYGSDYYCDAQSCTCQPVPVENLTVSCSKNTKDGSGSTLEKLASNLVCKDDCQATMGSDYSCEPVSCTCQKPKTVIPVSCALNSFDATFGEPAAPLPSGYICKDDCAEAEPGFVCDSSLCVCKPPITVQNGTSCSVNSFDDVYGHPKYQPGTMCKDDCKSLDPAWTCDSSTCTCKAPPEEKTVSCASNTVPGATTVERLGAGLICKDDCQASFGSGYTCNAASCTCQPPPTTGETFKCAGLEADGNKFNPALDKCEDNCKSIGSQFTCDGSTCTCKGPEVPREVGCAANGIVTQFSTTQKSTFDPALQICKDNCKELDEDLVCDAKTCTCTPKTVPKEIFCGDNTISSSLLFGGKNEFDPKVTQCKDDCRELGEAAGIPLVCDGATCTCKEDNSLSCAANSFTFGMSGGYLGNPNAMTGFGPGVQCKDDCKSFNKDAYCDQSCVCRVPGKETVSCASRVGTTLERLPAGVQCRDDCKEGYDCDSQSCSCVPSVTVTEVSCASRKYGETMEHMPAGAICKDDCQSLGSGYTCDASSCSCKGPQTAGMCGDGKILSPEQCDLGSAETNKCPQGTYCTNDCQCKKLETSVVCGDGKISSPGEDCDGGNVATNICQSGYKCQICKCVPVSTTSQCGDGTVIPPEECDHGNTYTEQCPGGLSCINCRCKTPTGVSETHTECDFAHQSCEVVSGAGQNECSKDSDCVQETTPQCGNGVRESGEQCDGSSSGCASGQTCSANCQCQGTTTTYYHYECDFAHGACMRVEGQGQSECGKDSDCSPPVINCPAYCEGQGYSQSLGGGYSSATACQAGAQESATQCTTKCVYSKFYSASNAAGTTTCCCKEVKTFSCSDCPGENPVCPDPNVVCPANKP
ncbi:MAG TPA: hypothetical protein VLD37_04590 [Candidatus Bilamarchaeum sp.]|nr:hypothetical protein [Candidatus Bilamarchaeum sp.]